VKKILTVFGTRPEAIKMAPVVRGLQARPDQFDCRVCVTAQHREMLDQVLRLFAITPDWDLDVMRPGQDLFQVTTSVLNGLKPVLEAFQPDMVLVHGDTTTTFAASLACFYLRIPVGHVEAGLRTFDFAYPFPEEFNRVVTDLVARLYFAPTPRSQANLLQLGVQPERIVVTGNTVIDALQYTLAHSSAPSPVQLAPGQRLVLVTVHRRENFGEPLQAICRALLQLLDQFAEVVMVIPVHPNPNVKPVVEAALGQHPRARLLPPQEYEPFCRLMADATLILTDSGGVQEEAPALSKPVLVLRDETERPEAVEMGTVQLVGPHTERIVAEASRLLSEPEAYAAMAHAVNPYGDGRAVERIIAALLNV
jgi:UDP-N-acetylglucosamine 2-epimerase (non-hydrolysing)